MAHVSSPRHASHSLNDVARRLAPHLRIVSASRPTPLLRDHNVLALTSDSGTGRQLVLSLESIEHADELLGTVVMSATGSTEPVIEDGNGHVDPEGVSRQIVPRVLLGGLVGAIIGALVVGGGALIFGASGWQLVGAAAAGAILMSVFGAMWLTFAGLGGSDAYRQTFVDSAASDLTIVSVHTDDPAEASAARSRLEGTENVRIITVDRNGQFVDEPPSSNTA
jgi:hypothetical protein